MPAGRCRSKRWADGRPGVDVLLVLVLVRRRVMVAILWLRGRALRVATDCNGRKALASVAVRERRDRELELVRGRQAWRGEEARRRPVRR
jgi:hypothetical protein